VDIAIAGFCCGGVVRRIRAAFVAGTVARLIVNASIQSTLVGNAIHNPEGYYESDEIKEAIMAKILECAKVDPSSGCQHIVRGETEEEVLQKAGEHAKEHGIRQVTPELLARVKANIRDA
jgi:predicted small metal-binding protein